MTRDTPAVAVDVETVGAQVLELVVGDAGEFSADHADWAEARFIRQAPVQDQVRVFVVERTLVRSGGMNSALRSCSRFIR
jgi:hypothetical protein